MKRRTFLAGTGAVAAAALASPYLLSRQSLAQWSPVTGQPLQQPPLLDAREGRLALRAVTGTTRFAGGAASPTMGFDQSYLGPTIRMRRGTDIKVRAENATKGPVTIHWHGLNATSEADGGPQVAFGPGKLWEPTLRVDQPAATLWYHTHVHGRTAPDVYAGLAGMILLEDDEASDLGLPETYGTDDLVLVIQDKRFDPAGRTVYNPGFMDRMMGFTGDAILTNGQLAPTAKVPAGPVRLRLVNGANASTFEIGFADRRQVQLIGVDQGLLPQAIDVRSVRLSPGERAELLVDFAESGEPVLLARQEPTGMMGMMGGGGMMGRGMGGQTAASEPQPVVSFTTDPTLPVKGTIPRELVAERGAQRPTGPRRDILLDAGMGPAMMSRRVLGRNPVMTINNRTYDMDRIDFEAKRGDVERWRVAGRMMAHPFHAHGVRFKRIGGTAGMRPEQSGWKDTMLIDGEAELLVVYDGVSTGGIPFVHHCHILEHEDSGMMGQYLVNV